MNKYLVVIIRLLNLGFDLTLIFLAIVNLIWSKATNGIDYFPSYSYELLISLSILIPLVLFYFLIRRLIDKLNHRKSSKLLIIVELGFVTITITALIIGQIAMITYLFDYVVFIGLLVGKALLIPLAIDSINDLKKNS